jgi:hypothetical protein
VCVEIGDRHVNIHEDDLTHIETGPRGDSFHLSEYLWEAALDDTPVEIVAESVEKLDIAAVSFPKKEIIDGEHPCEDFGVGGDQLFSVGNAAFVRGAANRYSEPSIIVILDDDNSISYIFFIDITLRVFTSF